MQTDLFNLTIPSQNEYGALKCFLDMGLHSFLSVLGVILIILDIGLDAEAR